MPALALLAALQLMGSPEPPPREDVVVMNARGEALSESKRQALTDLVAYGLSRRRRFRKVIGIDDIRAQLSREAMKQALNCDDTSCAAELGAALGARHLITTSANPLGEELVVAVTLIDTRSQDSRRALTRVHLKRESEWPQAVDAALSELFGAAATARPAAPASPEALRKQQIDAIATHAKPKCGELDVQASVEGGQNLEKHVDWHALPDHQWPGMMQGMGFHFTVVAYCGPKNLRAPAYRKARSIFDRVLARIAEDHSLRLSIEGYAEMLRRNPVRS